MTDEEKLSQLPAKEAAIWHTAKPVGGYPERTVSRRWAGFSSSGNNSLDDFIEEVTDRLARWRDGNYTIMEAAQILADSNPNINAIGFCKQIEDAAHGGELTIRENGIPVSATELENGRILYTPVRQTDVNKWLQSIDAGFELVYPYADTQPKTAPVVEATESEAGTSYSLPMFPRLVPRTTWTGGRITSGDMLTLADAASMASKHAGVTVTVEDILRAAGRGEIRLDARTDHDCKMQPCRDGDLLINNGGKIPQGSILSLPVDACRRLSISGRANWRIGELSSVTSLFLTSVV